METVFDWLTVATFAGLAVIYLQRSALPESRDRTWHYLPPAIGCALVNYLGNAGYVVVAGILLAVVLMYIYYVIKVRLGT